MLRENRRTACTCLIPLFFSIPCPQFVLQPQIVLQRCCSAAHFLSAGCYLIFNSLYVLSFTRPDAKIWHKSLIAPTGELSSTFTTDAENAENPISTNVLSLSSGCGWRWRHVTWYVLHTTQWRHQEILIYRCTLIDDVMDKRVRLL